MNHTPGPWWYAATYGDLYAVGAYDRELTRPISRADARLIAAAPDLAAVLQRALKWCEEHGDTRHKWYADGRAAIAKATGGQA